MALHTDHEAPSRMLQRLDEAIVRSRGHDQIAPNVAHRLVMHAVHVDTVVAGDGMETRCRRHLDVVRHLAARARRIVVVLSGEHRAHVLPERPAQSDVEYLGASADRQQRLVGLQSPSREQHLRAIELRVHLDGAVGANLLSVQRRLHVRAARKTETVAEVEQLVKAGLRECGTDPNRSRAGRFQRLEVRAIAREHRREGQFGGVAQGETDEW
jgi:hypothetical protein